MKTFIHKTGALMLAVAFAIAPVAPVMAVAVPSQTSVTITDISPDLGAECYLVDQEITVSGTATADAPPGQLSQYHVQIDWGDGTTDDVTESSAFGVGNEQGVATRAFSGTHTYANPGAAITITARIYHQTVPGQDGDADDFDSIDVCVIPPPTTGTIVVDKVTDPAQDAQSFSFTTTGTGYTGFSLTDTAAANSQTVNAGTYSVAETAVAGWTQTSAVCVSSIQDAETPGSIELDAGETVTCTFTNTKDVPPPTYQCNDGVDNDQDGKTDFPADPGCGSSTDDDETDTQVDNTTITIVKQTNPDGDPQTFTFKVNDVVFGSAIADNGTTTAEVEAGFKKIEEIVPTGWTMDSISCVNEQQVVVGGHDGDPYYVELVAGDDITCTVNNTKIVTPPVDVCPNLEGNQSVLPEGYHYDNEENCVPDEVRECSVTVVSDATNTVDEKGGAFAKLLTYIHPNWTAVIPGANWIWGDDPVAAPVNNVSQTFVKTFNWNGPVTNATLTIAADNSYSSTLNGDASGADATANNFGAADTYDVASLIDQGTNTLSINVLNWEHSTDPAQNPAGLKYKLVVTGTDPACGDVPPPPVDVCPNLEGAQSVLPEGYHYDNEENCVPDETDYCPNIEGMQSSVPDGYYVDNEGQCEQQGGGGGGKRISMSSDDGEVLGDSDEKPVPEVAGAQTAVLPAGAPNTGMGGAANTAATATMLGSFLTMALGALALRRKTSV